MIDPSIAQQIKDCTKIEDIIHDFVNLKKSGASLSGECPYCRQAKKFVVTPSKQIYKCFKCDKGGNSAIQFLIDYKKLSYPDALRYCADKKGILVEDMKNGQTDLPDAPSFRDQQLRQSGIGEEHQRCQLADGSIVNRYESAAIGKGWTMAPGDDLLLNYVDLDGHLTIYLQPETHKPVQFKRVRFKYPEQQKDKSGNPVKYLQPPKSGSHLWIPELARKAFSDNTEVETLFVTEGEKKADKLCIHGMVAFGIMGIHNLSLDEKMSDEFKLFVQKCKVKNVVFLLDADWRDISNMEDKPADERPNTFFAAVKKFRDYFIHYNNEGIQLDIYLACLKRNANQDKGVDDLLVNTLKGSEDKLLHDFETAKMDRQGNGEYLECHNITTMSEFKLKDMWLLNDVKQFAEFHMDALSKRVEFRFDKKQWRMDADGEVNISNPLLPEEQYWSIEETTDRNSGNVRRKYNFEYQKIRIFLRNRGFGRLALANGNYRFILIEGKVVKDVNHIFINNFVTLFTEEIGEMEVLNMVLRGGTQYLGPDKLDKLYELKLNFIQPEPNCQYLYFKTCFWKVTEDGITQGRLDDLHNYIWKEQLIDFEPELTKTPILDIEMEGNRFVVKTSKEAENCHFFKFLERTSMFGWQTFYELEEGENGLKSWRQHGEFVLTGKAHDEFVNHFVAKVIALGYLLHQYPNKSEAKAIICMDGLETEVGASEGGTGKSIFGKCLEHLVKVVTLDGKKHNLTEDSFIYEEVDERTKVIFFDDCRANLDFEFFFGQITTGITVNGKGLKRYSLPAPKFLFTTNHAINGDGNSFKRRQFLLSFSDWYNEFRTPKDDFGCILFDDWDHTQWDLFYNFMACCIQAYLRFGLRYSIPSDGLEKRKLRQQIGDNLIEWASSFFDPTGNRNKRVNKKLAYDDFIDSYPNDKKYCHTRHFKKKLKLFCTYSGLQFNPNGQGGAGKDIKSNGQEYYVVADENFDANACITVGA